ncbi:MAG: branched-chain amino acid ABC transporter substrate-binding protein [Actinobacteria bacterium]|nr:branched-chain amino acid ABC transporter substrate-binding protein [Actinomycetota bacterium]
MKKKRNLGFLALLAVLSLVIAACAPGEAETPAECEADEFGCVEVAGGEAIKIGSLLVITGPNSSLGLDSQYGVELALDYWGADEFDGEPGELLGHPLELVAEDDGCSAEGGTAGANSLAADEQVVAVIGTSCSSAALGVADTMFSDRGIAIVSPSNTGPALTTEENHKEFYLRTAHNDSIQGAAVANFAYTELGLRSAATIHDGSPYADGLQQVFADVFSELGGTITKQEAIQVGDTDFNPVLTDIAADAPEFLYFPIFVAEGGLITQQARAIDGLADTVLAGSDGMFTPDWIAAAGADNANGVYISGPDLASFSGDVDFYTGGFIPAYTDAYGEPQSVFHAHAWDATNMILAAIEEVAIEVGDTLFIPRTGLKDALFATSNFPGITGNLTCNPLGDCQPSATIAVVTVENGEFTEAVYSELGTLGG